MCLDTTQTGEADIATLMAELNVNEKDKEREEVNIHDTNLWNSEEIDVLRKVFKAAKSENSSLKAHLKAYREQLRKLERKYKKQSSILEVRTQKLREAHKANERLKIVADSCTKRLTAADATVEYLHEEIKDLRETQSRLSKESHSLRLELDRERIDRKNTQHDLVNQQQVAIREMQLREEKLNLLHQEDIEFLQNQIDTLTEELEKEKSNHQRSLRGLQHLRNHFSNVPLADNTAESNGKANIIRSNELKQFTL